MKKQIPWTLFWDMHSGGCTKEDPYDKIYIQASKEEAKVIFYNRFGHNPDRVSCTCCGSDYSISESPTLEDASGFHRNCRYAYKDPKGKEVPQNKAWVSGKGLKRGYYAGYVEERDDGSDKYYNTKAEAKKSKPYIKLKNYIKQKDVLVIYDKDIKASERTGSIPKQGYVWVD